MSTYDFQFLIKLANGRYLSAQTVAITTFGSTVIASQVLPNGENQTYKIQLDCIDPEAEDVVVRMNQMATSLKMLINSVIGDGMWYGDVTVDQLSIRLLEMRLRLSPAAQFTVEKTVRDWLLESTLVVSECFTAGTVDPFDAKAAQAKLLLKEKRIWMMTRRAELAKIEEEQDVLKREIAEYEAARRRLQGPSDKDLSSFPSLNVPFPDNKEQEERDAARKEAIRIAGGEDEYVEQSLRKELSDSKVSDVEESGPCFKVPAGAAWHEGVAIGPATASSRARFDESMNSVQSSAVDSWSMKDPVDELDASKVLEKVLEVERDLVDLDKLFPSEKFSMEDSQAANPPSFDRLSVDDKPSMESSSLELILEPTQSDLDI